jgi:rsbT co-antagonist protein RsbR
MDSTFFDEASAPLAVLDREGRITRANAAFTRAMSDAASVSGLPFGSLVRASDRDAATAAIGSPTPAAFDARPEKAAQAIRFQATRAKSGDTYLVGVESAHLGASDAARLALFDRVLESAPVTLFALDAEGTYTAWEGKGVESVGTKRGELVGRSALDVWKDSEAFPHVLRAIAGEEFQAPIALENGVYADTWFVPNVDAAGHPNGGIGFAIDVTAQRKAEKELRDKLAIIEKQNATLKMFSRVLDTAPIVLWAIDREGAYTMSEGRGLDLLGFRPGESIGVNALEMYRDRPDEAKALVQALSGEESRVMTTPVPGVYMDSWYMPLRSRDGTVYGAMGLGIDATERVKGEVELREKLELIERQSATIRALATPIIQVWDEILCLPVIGTVDSARTAEMMQGLLEAIVRQQARYAIIDLTGVEIVDTSTADHLIQLFRAAKVLGVEGILCGIRPAVAQTVVALGLELGTVRTMRSLRDALKWCIKARGSTPRAGRAHPTAGE